MAYETRIIDRDVGRNAQLFAQAVGKLETPAERYPYLRILVSLLDQAHPEWDELGGKDQQIANLARQLSEQSLSKEEVAEVARIREEEG